MRTWKAATQILNRFFFGVKLGFVGDESQTHGGLFIHLLSQKLFSELC